MTEYLTENDMEHLARMEIGLEIKGVKREIVDGRPRMVLYFENCGKGLPLTRKLKENLTELLGPHPKLEVFFNSGEDVQ
jgi:hypothetical protein